MSTSAEAETEERPDDGDDARALVLDAFASPSMCPPHEEVGRRPEWLRTAALLMISSALGASCRTAPAPETTIEGPSTMTFVPDATLFGLGPGDVLRADVRGQERLSTPPEGTALDGAGALHLPVVGAISLAGRSIGEARDLIERAFESIMHEPDVTVSLLRAESNRYYVLGQIQEPGPRPMSGPVTALEGLSAGGFFLNAADRSCVFLVRPHGERIEVHEFDAETPDAAGLVQLHPGDILFVRRRGTQRFQEEFLPLLQPWQIAVPAAAAAGVF